MSNLSAACVNTTTARQTLPARSRLRDIPFPRYESGQGRYVAASRTRLRSRPLLPPVADLMSQHHKVAIRVLHEDFYLACLTITCSPPYLSGSEVYRPIHRSEFG